MTKNEWLKTCERITENAAEIYSDATGMIFEEGDTENIAVHQFEIGVLLETIRDGKTMYQTISGNADIYDSDFDKVADFLWEDYAQYFAKRED